MAPLSRLFLPLAVLVAVALNARAQEQPRPDTSGVRSIEQEILAQPDPDAVRLGKARAALFNAVQSGDTSMARRTLRYLEQRFDTTYITPLYPGECLLMAYLVGEYPAIYQMTATVDDRMTPNYSKIVPISDRLFTRLRDYAINHRQTLSAAIRSSGEGREECDFLQLLLRDILNPGGDNTVLNQATQDSINTQADEFIGDYPASRFIPFVRRQIRFVLRSSPWGLGYNLGIGYLAVPRQMRAFGDYVDIALAVEASYLDWYGELRVDLGAGHKLSAPFEYNGSWPKDMITYPVGGVLSAGRMFTLSRLLRITPYLSIGGLSFAPSQEEREKNGKDLSLDLGYWGPGGHLDLLLGEEYYIRLTASARFNFSHTDVAGSQYLFITFGFGAFSHSMIREE